MCLYILRGVAPLDTDYCFQADGLSPCVVIEPLFPSKIGRDGYRLLVSNQQLSHERQNRRNVEVEITHIYEHLTS